MSIAIIKWRLNNVMEPELINFDTEELERMLENALNSQNKEEQEQYVDSLVRVWAVTSKSDGYSKTQQAAHEKYLRSLCAEFDSIWRQRFYSSNVDKDDFKKIKIIGTGAFGVVYLVNYTPKDKYYAMKILEKAKVVKLKQIEHSYYEKKILCGLNFPFCVYMKYFFKDNVYLYYVLPYIPGGELFSHLRKKGKFDEKTSKFYASQVVLALEYMHFCQMVYRDLKPENILIDKSGYIKITDFGFTKILRGRTWTLCGTPEYLAPEILNSKGYGFSADWWSFGILCYEMSAGYPPFYAPEHVKIYEKIAKGKYKMPRHFSDSLKNLLKNTIIIDRTKRFGELKDGVLDFKNHAWFREINWDDILNLRVEPPYIPKIKSAGDGSHFQRYAKQAIKESPYNLYEDEFYDF